jgi:hypothetical protein
MPIQVKYVGQSLTSLVTEATYQATRSAARRIAQTGQDIMFEEARAATPSRTGRTRASWLKHEIEHRDDRLEGRVTNDDPTAVYLQYGTESHAIKPEHGEALRTPQGPRADVHVSGIQPAHMTERAALVTEATISERSVPALETWKRECEEAIDLAKKRIR